VALPAVLRGAVALSAAFPASRIPCCPSARLWPPPALPS